MAVAATDKLGDRSRIMAESPIPRLLMTMSVPSIVSMLITSVYNMADTYFVHFLGTSATGAVGVNFAIERIIMMAGTFVAMGANSYIARLLGSGNKDKASGILSTGFFIAAAFGTLVAVLGISFTEGLVTLLGAPPTVIPYAVAYGKNLLYAAPFMCASFVMNLCLRAEGNASYAMWGMASGGLLNIALDPLFMFTFGLGIAGAAIATTISKLVSFTILILPYIRKTSVLQLSIRNVRFVPRELCEIATVGSSSLFRNLFGVVSGILINKIAGNYSDACLAAISASTKIMMVPFSIFIGFGGGLQPICGYNWGAKRYDRVKESVRLAVIVSLVAPILIAVVIGSFSGSIIALFTENDLELMRIGRIAILTECIAMPIHATCVAINMAYAGLGRAKEAFLLSTARQGSCFLPVVFLLPKLFGSVGVACTQGVADILTLCLTAPMAIKLFKELRTLE